MSSDVTVSLETCSEASQKSTTVTDRVLVLRNAEGLTIDSNNAIFDEIFVYNPTAEVVIFKIKRTSPDIIRVKPGYGFLQPRQLQKIKVRGTIPIEYDIAGLSNRISVLIAPIAVEEKDEKSAQDLWLNVPPEARMKKTVPIDFFLARKLPQKTSITSGHDSSTENDDDDSSTISAESDDDGTDVTTGTTSSPEASDDSGDSDSSCDGDSGSTSTNSSEKVADKGSTEMPVVAVECWTTTAKSDETAL